MKRRLAAALPICALLLCTQARAEEGEALTGTLRTIAARGTVLIGYRESSPPFSFRNAAGQPIGFSVDLCHGIAEDIAATLHRDLLEPDAPAWQTGIRITYVPIGAAERLPKLTSGAIDLECGSTTANQERAKTIAFSPVFFLAGTKLMVPLVNGRPSATSYRALAGKVVAVSAGTTNAAVMQRLAHTLTPPITVKEAPNLDAAYEMLSSGAAQGFASDDILLAGFLATKPDGKRFTLTGEYLSFEPYAIGFRRDDPAFATLVRDSFTRMASEGTLAHLYQRWLMDRLPNGERLNMPMSPQLAEMYRALGQPD